MTGTYHNVTYISPAKGDLTESNPLVVPTKTTDTSTTDTNNDAQADITIDPVSIGDFVWLDNNRNGVQDSGEPGVKGVTVTLTDADGGTKTATTDDNGYYWFTDLMPGAKYTLTFTSPDGHSWTIQDADAAPTRRTPTLTPPRARCPSPRRCRAATGPALRTRPTIRPWMPAWCSTT